MNTTPAGAQRGFTLFELLVVVAVMAILLAMILRELHGVLLEFSRHGFAPFQAEWENHHALHHQPVRLSLPDGASISGIARGITDNGALILETSSGRKIFNSGEIGFTEL